MELPLLHPLHFVLIQRSLEHLLPRPLHFVLQHRELREHPQESLDFVLQGYRWMERHSTEHPPPRYPLDFVLQHRQQMEIPLSHSQEFYLRSQIVPL